MSAEDQQQVTGTTSQQPSESRPPRQPRKEPWEDEQLTLRMLMTHPTAAGAIIGKAGGIISSVREECDVRAGVSKAVPGIPDRILTVTGHLEGVAKAYGIFAANLLENQNQLAQHNGEAQANVVTMRLLIGHQLMGSIIGKGGVKIKEIQEKSGSRLVAGKDMLPQSTERTIDVTGAPTGQIEAAVKLILQAILDDLRRGGRERWMVVQGSLVLYQPGGKPDHPPQPPQQTGRRESTSTGQQERRRSEHHVNEGGQARGEPRERRTSETRERRPHVPAENEQTQSLTVPSDLVGCIIGRGGSQIASIRRESQARISISREPVNSSADNANNGGERLFTISGTPEANTRALELIYAALEAEKNRREQGGVVAE